MSKLEFRPSASVNWPIRSYRSPTSSVNVLVARKWSPINSDPFQLLYSRVQQAVVVNRRKNITEEIGSVLACVKSKEEIGPAEELGE